MKATFTLFVAAILALHATALPGRRSEDIHEPPIIVAPCAAWKRGSCGEGSLSSGLSDKHRRQHTDIPGDAWRRNEAEVENTEHKDVYFDVQAAHPAWKRTDATATLSEDVYEHVAMASPVWKRTTDETFYDDVSEASVVWKRATATPTPTPAAPRLAW